MNAAKRQPQKPPRTSGIRYKDLDPDVLEKMVGQKPSKRFISDGVSSGPDSVGPISLLEPAFVHDWEYAIGGSEKDRRKADSNLWRNCRTVGLGWIAANFVYAEVRAYGFDHFAYIGKEPGWAYRCWTWCVRWAVFLTA